MWKYCLLLHSFENVTLSVKSLMKKVSLESSFGVAGDPVLISDRKGSLYNFHLSNPGGGGRDANWIDRIVCQTSDNNGLSWNDGSFAGLNSPKS